MIISYIASLSIHIIMLWILWFSLIPKWIKYIISHFHTTQSQISFIQTFMYFSSGFICLWFIPTKNNIKVYKVPFVSYSLLGPWCLPLSCYKPHQKKEETKIMLKKFSWIHGKKKEQKTNNKRKVLKKVMVWID